MLSSVTVKQQPERKHKKTFKKSVSRNNDSISPSKKVENADAVLNTQQNSSEVVIDLKEFPELRSCSAHSFDFHTESVPTTKSKKSWFSNISRGSSKNHTTKADLTDSWFPELAGTKGLNETKGDSNSIRVQDSYDDTSVTNCVVQKQKHDDELLRKPDPLKKAPTQSQRNPNKKKRADPIFVNLQEILKVNKSQKKTKQHRAAKTKFHRQREKECLSGNYLDSSNPKRNRGKHREIKKRKLTNLKLCIIKERIIKQKIRENLVATYLKNENVELIDTIDFKREIALYLNELAKRKIKKSKGDDKNAKPVATIENKQQENEQKEVEVTIQDVGKVKHEKNVPQTDVGVKFSSKLREYCDNILTPELNVSVTELIKELVSLQDRLFARDPIKAKVKKRHVSGIKEVKKHLTIKKVKLIVIAPNLEKMQMEGSVYDLIEELKVAANAQNVPYAFALDRYKLGRCTRKNVPVSAFAVLNYEGVENLFNKVLDHLGEAKSKFAERMRANRRTEEEPDVNAAVLSSLIMAFQEQVEIPREEVDSDSHKTNEK